MRISTKTLASLLIFTAVAAATPRLGSKERVQAKRNAQFDRILQRHDRKGELRAEILGLHPLEFRDLQKRMSFAEIAHRKGFHSEQAFRTALYGKIKNELHNRGWTTRRIEQYVMARSGRLV
ncbi:MAG TPA: hypothetical protein VIQ80_02840 [Candidatus Saccharimonadales bacterium]